eukprot:CAMPEP_0119281026 /NCGR_PEP_ID=MMETSP1329-20130426/23889_1 /TAXON_ID=114041 /ORGANISM="Genus nov. species nov., Strain RCC1024" /LENGTH=269 /DNA_ID=CAMNT_0007281629 /DNA_START=24 /DNA_END=833 /DNA_ORIENTATION=-
MALRFTLYVSLLGAASAGKTTLGYSTGGGTDLPLGINPTASTGDWTVPGLDALPVTVTVGAAYELAALKTAPKSLTVKASHPKVKLALDVLTPFGSPELKATAKIGDVGGGDLAEVTLDSTEPTPKLVRARDIAIPDTSAVLSPSWNPRVKGAKGLSVDLDATMSASSSVSATLAPEARPKLSFHFGIDDTASLDVTPLLGDGGKSTKFAFSKSGLPHGVSAKATLMDKSLSLLAKIKVASGALEPSVGLDLGDLKAKPTLSLKQSYAL